MFLLSYWVLPVISGVVWLGTLLGLLIYWTTDAHEVRYPSMSENQHIAYISDIAAGKLKPLFIAGCAVTTVFLDAAFAADRWLRHRGRLVPNTTTAEKVLSGLTIATAICGTAGLILLSVFDVEHHKNLHDGFLLLFIAGYVLSAIFICWEYQRLGVRNREHPILRVSFYIKLSFIVLAVLLAIAFVACTFTGTYNAGAVLEWAVAFIFSLYVFSFVIDLLPAVRTGRHYRDYRARHIAGQTAGTWYGRHGRGQRHHAEKDAATSHRSDMAEVDLEDGRHGHGSRRSSDQQYLAASGAPAVAATAAPPPPGPPPPADEGYRRYAPDEYANGYGYAPTPREQGHRGPLSDF